MRLSATEKFKLEIHCCGLGLLNSSGKNIIVIKFNLHFKRLSDPPDCGLVYHNLTGEHGPKLIRMGVYMPFGCFAHHVYYTIILVLLSKH